MTEADGEFVVFNAYDTNLEIAACRTSEVYLSLSFMENEARVPVPVFRGIARILRFYPLKVVRLAFSAGVLAIDRAAFRHKDISILPRSVSVRQGR